MYRLRPSVLALLLLLPGVAFASDPGGEFPLSTRLVRDQDGPAVAMAADGSFVAAWNSYDDEHSGIYARRFSAAGVPLGDEFRVGFMASDNQQGISVSLDDAGISFAWWGSGNHTGPVAFFRRFNRTGTPLSNEIFLGAKASPAVASDRQGNSTVLVADGAGLSAFRFNPQGRQVGKVYRIAASASRPALARGAGDGLIGVWSTSRGIEGRVFRQNPAAAGRGFRVAADLQTPPSLGAAPDGRFAVAWSTEQGVRVRLFRPTGEPRTGILRVTNPAPGFFEGPVAVAMDAAGRTLVVWTSCNASFRDCRVFGRRLDALGRSEGWAGLPFRIDSGGYSSDSVATAGPAGRFVTVWERLAPEGDGGTSRHIHGRRLPWIAAGDAPCVHRGNRFLCDGAHDGGEEEISNDFGRAGDLPLLGDPDGDGRDDPCLYKDGQLLCDTRHDGGAAEVRIAFGQSGDVPLLADLDGEGRDDACVRRGAELHCDSAHNGGTAELIVLFGNPGDLFLMGDVDGDGDDDPCVARDGLLLCDTEHDGGTAEVIRRLDLRPGDIPLLGDLDGDGDDDPCLRGEDGRFVCDLGDGGDGGNGGADLVILFGDPDDAPLLGDLDGG